MLPCQENLFLWKVSNSNKCRFGCDVTENYNHLQCICSLPKVNRYKVNDWIDNEIARVRGQTFLSHIFYAIFKYWVKNNNSLSIKNWIFCEVTYWQLVYSHTKASFDLLNKFISKWLELSQLGCMNMHKKPFFHFVSGRRVVAGMFLPVFATPCSCIFSKGRSRNTGAVNNKLSKNHHYLWTIFEIIDPINVRSKSWLCSVFPQFSCCHQHI